MRREDDGKKQASRQVGWGSAKLYTSSGIDGRKSSVGLMLVARYTMLVLDEKFLLIPFLHDSSPNMQPRRKNKKRDLYKMRPEKKIHLKSIILCNRFACR